ncbi:MAG TPA: hypothetical protein VLT62_23585 [Candidatus Methylomirabilis sp.]|nr:hypothetical protein [Candidatus Methylomirabilis sp.]
MRSRLASYLLWAFLLAQGVGVLSAACIGLAGGSWRRMMGDALFLEGAVLLVAGGLIDVGRSLTVAHIRGLGERQAGDPPPRIRKPGRTYVLLIAGLLLCLQGALFVYLFPARPG